MPHHIHTASWRGAAAKTLSWGKSIGKPRCRESVHESGRSVGFSQCVRVGVVEEVIDGEKMVFCRQHSLVEQDARRAKSQAKYDAESARARAKWKAQMNAPKFQAALEKIAAGHNDARGLAEEVLKEAGVAS